MASGSHPYAQPQPPLPRLPLPTTTSTSTLPSSSSSRGAPPRPLQGLPPLPHQHPHRHPQPAGRALSTDPSATLLPSSSSSYPDLSIQQQQRARGESSPAVSRYSNRNAFQDWDAQSAQSSSAASSRRPEPMRRQSSGPGGAGVSRRTVVGEDGREREETREERRARKERERAARGEGGEDGHAPRPRPVDGMDFNAGSLGAPPIPSSSLPSSSSSTLLPPPPSSTPSTSSKSVLTVALQRAQSAVLLDSANNFPAAIAAYSQSVRLLKEVMARVEDGGREMERKLSTGGVREGESMEEYERRKQRYERKEKAKMDEARRLRVIHDTYEDRIRMLVQMGTPLPPNTILSPSIASLASLQSEPPTPFSDPSSAPLSANSSTTAHPSPALSQHSFASTSSAGTATGNGERPPSMVYRRHRSDREAADEQQQQQRHQQQQRSISSLQQVLEAPTGLNGGEDGGEGNAADGIGSAMLQESDGDGEAGPAQRVPQIGGLPVLSAPPGVAGLRRPESVSSDSTATATAATTPNTATAASQPSPLSAAPSSSRQQHRHSRSADFASSSTFPVSTSSASISSGEGDDQPLHTAVEYASSSSGWPASRSREASAPIEEEAEEVAPLPYSAHPLTTGGGGGGEESRRPSIASMAMRRGSSASALTTTSDATLRAGGGSISGPAGLAGGEAMRRAASAQSAGSSATLEIRPRPSRSASLASSAAMSAGGSGGAESGRQGALVNASTAEGTIFQRRQRTPVPGEEGAAVDGVPSPPGANIVVRAPSSDIDRTSAQYAQLPLPPPPPAPPSSRPFSGSSLPGRLRALSQPGSKRPKLQSFDSEQAPARPPLPPLLSTANRSASTTHTPSASVSSSSNGSASAASRKGSVPTPTSLNAPLPYPGLGRSNSSSSIGSSSSASAYRAERLAQLNGGAATSVTGTETPTSSVFPRHGQHPSQSAPAGGAAGPYLASGLPSPPAASSPSSREATLSIPPVRRPFHLMRLVVATIPSSSSARDSGATAGGYLSERLFVPSQVWTTQGGAKLVAIETKVRMLDLLSTGLDALDKAGRGLLLIPVQSSAASRAARDEALRFGRELEAFEGLAEGIQSTLGKKLGTGVVGTAGGGVGGGGGAAEEKDPKTGRKGSTASFSAWSSKLSMSLNRVTNGGASLDSQATYVDAIAKVFKQAQSLDHHLALLFPSTTSSSLDSVPGSPPASSANPDSNPYLLLSAAERHRLERQLRKASEFFGVVICRFVLRDTGVLLDKYVKRGGAWLTGE
ncbi:hypothetical protein JCM8547_005114 [Rhodosporidiobolus lusitaniae]